MKGKIDEYGCLQIERAGEWVRQDCIYDRRGYLCGHKCPHFGEPEAEWQGGACTGLRTTGCTLLRLCHGTVLVFDECTDERSAT